MRVPSCWASWAECSQMIRIECVGNGFLDQPFKRRETVGSVRGLTRPKPFFSILQGFGVQFFLGAGSLFGWGVAGRTCLMFVVTRNEYRAMVKTGNECQLTKNMSSHGKNCHAVCCAKVLLQPSFFWCCLSHCLRKTRHPTCGLWYGLGTEHVAYHGT